MLGLESWLGFWPNAHYNRTLPWPLLCRPCPWPCRLCLCKTSYCVKMRLTRIKIMAFCILQNHIQYFIINSSCVFSNLQQFHDQCLQIWVTVTRRLQRGHGNCWKKTGVPQISSKKWNFRSLELSLPRAKVLWNFRSRESSSELSPPGAKVLVMYNFDVDPEPVVASQESDSLSVVSPHQQRRWRAGTTGSIARHAPASWTYTSWLLYKEATFVMV